MGEFSKTLKEFQKSSGDHYQKLIDALEEDHCWKCPMRSTSSQANCKELHAWLKIQKALEEGVSGKIGKNRSEEELEAITARFLEKRFKKEKSQDTSALLILKVEEDLHRDIPENSILLINPHPKKVKKDDLVLIPHELPCPVSWFFKAGLMVGVPFQVARVSQSYHQGPLWYLETVDGMRMPLAFLLGRVLKVLDEDSALFHYFQV
ncbi:MAG: hypothetical protein ABFC91_02475 [Methanobacteriaceae archaeon]